MWNAACIAAEECPCFSSLFTSAAEQPPQIKRVLSQALPDGPRASHTFTGLSGCPRVLVSVKVELIDMSYYNERENVRARLSGASRDKPSLWSECRFNSVVDKGSTCGEEGYVMCGEDAAALVGPSGDLTVEVLGSKHITQPCDDGVALSALVTAECSGSSAVICPISGILSSTESRHCRDESSVLSPTLPIPPDVPELPSDPRPLPRMPLPVPSLPLPPPPPPPSPPPPMRPSPPPPPSPPQPMSPEGANGRRCFRFFWYTLYCLFMCLLFREAEVFNGQCKGRSFLLPH